MRPRSHRPRPARRSPVLRPSPTCRRTRPTSDRCQGVRVGVGTGAGVVFGVGAAEGAGVDDGDDDGEAIGLGDGEAVSPDVAPVGLSVPGAELPAGKVYCPPYT